jgi:hypothetical protein
VGRPFIDPGAAGPLHEPEQPVFAFDRELGALERAFYRHVRRAIDLDALFGLEQLLWCELERHGPFTDDQVLDISTALLARSLERVAHDPLRSMKEGTRGPGGQLVELPEAPHEGCPFCGPRARADGSAGGLAPGRPRAGAS